MQTDKHQKYSRALPIIQRHWRTTLPFLTLARAANIIKLNLEMRLKKTVISGQPYFIKIEPTNRCNLRCDGCLHAANRTELADNRYFGEMELGLFKNIIDQLHKYLVKVSLYSMGEPFIYPHILDMLAYLKAHKIGSVISSNLNLLTPDLIEGMVRNKLTHLIVSLDGYDSESYNKYRRGGDFDQVIGNIKAIQAEKHKQGSKYPLIEIQTVKLEHITDEAIAKIKQLAQELKVEKFTLKENVSPHYDDPQPEERQCFWLYGNPQIHWNGRLQPCCHYYEYENNVFGDLKTVSLASVWNNEKYQAARRYFGTGKREEGMDIKCYSCIFFKPKK
jgi:sulfatase maturation enzyme AslB (radical SAM superfamily)